MLPYLITLHSRATGILQMGLKSLIASLWVHQMGDYPGWATPDQAKTEATAAEALLLALKKANGHTVDCLRGIPMHRSESQLCELRGDPS